MVVVVVGGGGGGSVTERYRGGGGYGRGIVYIDRSVIEEDPSPSVCPVCREYPLLRAARAARVYNTCTTRVNTCKHV